MQLEWPGGISQLTDRCGGSDDALPISGSVFAWRATLSASLSDCFSRGAWLDAASSAVPAHVECEVVQPDSGPGPNCADPGGERAAHVVGLRTEDLFDANPHAGPGPVGRTFGLFSQPLAVLALAAKVAFQLAVARLDLDLHGPTGRSHSAPDLVWPCTDR